MCPRHAGHPCAETLARRPAAVLVGPRKAGKTAPAIALTQASGAVYVDPERSQDRAMLAEPEACFRASADRPLILNEI